jgi:immunity protein, SdpI family
MSTRTTLFLTLALIIIAVVFSMAVYSRLPDQMASHWDVNDRVDGQIHRFWGAFLMPVISIGMLGLFLLIPVIDPLKANIAKFREAFNAFIALITVFLLYLHVLTISWNLGYQNFKMSLALLPAVGLILIFAGLMMRKAKRNFFIGIRTPWTLSSDKVWDQTHRVGSWLFIGAGALAMVGGFFGGFAAFLLMFVPLMGSTIFLLVYSYVLYRRESQA